MEIERPVLAMASNLPLGDNATESNSDSMRNRTVPSRARAPSGRGSPNASVRGLGRSPAEQAAQTIPNVKLARDTRNANADMGSS